MWPLVNCPREMPFLGLLFTLLIPLDSQIHFVFRAKRKIWKIMCTKNKIKYLTVLPLKIILWRSQAYFVFYLFFFTCLKKYSWDFPGGPVTGDCASKAGGPGSIPGQGTKLHMLQGRPGAVPATVPSAPQKSQRLLFFFCFFFSFIGFIIRCPSWKCKQTQGCF